MGSRPEEDGGGLPPDPLLQECLAKLRSALRGERRGVSHRIASQPLLSGVNVENGEDELGEKRQRITLNQKGILLRTLRESYIHLQTVLHFCRHL